MRIILWVILMVISLPSYSSEFKFDGISGGQLHLRDFHAKAVLVVNTASRCGFTPQYSGLQKLYDQFKDRGLVVLAVPSGDFRQELKQNDLVKQFCKINYDLTIPMTSITSVRGPNAHPFYKWIKKEYGFTPSWNFNKILLNHEGHMVASFGSTARPTGRRITRSIHALLNESAERKLTQLPQ